MIEGQLRCEELDEYLTRLKSPRDVWLFEDGSSIVPRIFMIRPLTKKVDRKCRFWHTIAGMHLHTCNCIQSGLCFDANVLRCDPANIRTHIFTYGRYAVACMQLYTERAMLWCWCDATSVRTHIHNVQLLLSMMHRL